MELLVAQSYSKNLGLYAERIGAINVVCTSADAAARCCDQNVLCFVYFLVYGKLALPQKKKSLHDQMNKCTTSSSRLLIFYIFAMLNTSLHGLLDIFLVKNCIVYILISFWMTYLC